MHYLRRIRAWLLKKISHLVLWKYRPAIVGVTGSVGKTSTKIAIAAVLGADRRVRFSPDSHNTEEGLALAIIGEWSKDDLRLVSKDSPEGAWKVKKIFFWLRVLWRGFSSALVRRPYPEVLVLEYGVDRPHDMKRLLKIARPNVGVMTAIGEIPVHVEFFSGPEELGREKVRLLESLSSGSYAILNADDDTVMAMQDRTRAHRITFGFAKGADIRIANFEPIVEDGEPKGSIFKFEHAGVSIPIRLKHAFGKAQAYAAAAAACVGVAFGMNLARIADALATYEPAEGRMNLIPGIKSSYIINDAFNASPLSMRAALDALFHLPGKRKVAVLGDMLEIGTYSIQAHEAIGELAAKFVQMLVTVGPRGKLIAESALAHGLKKTAVRSFDSAEDAAAALPGIIKTGDLVLVKASHAIGLDEAIRVLREPHLDQPVG